MTVSLNNKTLHIDAEGSTYGEVLAAIDELAENSGDVIIQVNLDGKDLDPSMLALYRDKIALASSTLTLTSISSKELKTRAYGTALDVLNAILAYDGKTATSIAETEELHKAVKSYNDIFSEILDADEVSCLKEVESALETCKADKTSLTAIAGKAQTLSMIFAERLSEIQDPIKAMRATAIVFSGEKSALAEVPVKLQTGCDGEAFATILRFVELFNKANRVLPLLGFSGIDGSTIRPGGTELKDFYDSINDILRRMMDAFERKDTVLLGDLVEYEILPRVSAFFTALETAMEKSA